ncbi:hypothetical protein [Haliscomenobacter sp.]|uniref:Cas10/Cmr2 second palm domain-containing protein n=1 Tax=Haliscomenobacter sp. TaxID=2717303 RepID=UPI003593CE65
MDQYLYGANVNQIQSFIFETSRLKEIVGASELVEQICKQKFIDAVNATSSGYKEANLLIGAAGKITYIFEHQQDCQVVLHTFQKSVLEEIPGLSFSQAVVKFNSTLQQDDFHELEKRLGLQRHRQRTQHGLGLMISERSRRTGGAAFRIEKTEDGTNYLDRRQHQKIKYHEESKHTLLEKMLGDTLVDQAAFATEIEYLLEDQKQGWIAIVHADGNNLGTIIKQVRTELIANKGDLQDFSRLFSKKLDEATIAAAQDAYKQTVDPVFQNETIFNAENGRTTYLPIRPVILGGDDLTVIIRGELALGFTEAFLKGFEHHTKNKFAELATQFKLNNLGAGLSACAGIAYIKPKYPFHYGVNLADVLCKEAKERAKADATVRAKDFPGFTVQSALMFHRVLSSFVEDDFEPLAERELNTNSGIGFDYGPYFIEKQVYYSSTSELRDWVKYISEDDAPKAPLREWLTALDSDKASAEQLMERIKSINKSYIEKLGLNKPFDPRGKTTHLYDVITIASIEKK